MNDTISEILTGSFDLHVHAGPDTRERRLDALQTARHAYEAEMAGFVLKSHEYPTAPLAGALRQMYPGLDVAGAIALNRSVGGVNPDAVEVSARLGAKVVWMPTFDADAWRRGQGRGPGLRIADDSGALTPATRAVLEIVRARDMVLASGHLSPRETLELFRAAREAGITRMIATHPAATASIEQQREMADLGAYVEYTFLSCMPSRAQMTVEELAVALRRIGTDRCILTTDFGQWMNPPAPEGMRMAIAALLGADMTADEVSALVKHNPLRLMNE